MRILVITCYSLPHVGGLQTLVDQEVRALAAAGHEVTLVTSNARTLAFCPEYPPNVQVHRIAAVHFLESMFNIYYPLFSPRLFFVLWSAVAQCDIVHVHGVVFLGSILGALLARLRGKPLVLTEHAGRYNSSNRLASTLAYLLEATIGRITTRLATRLIGYGPAIVEFLERLANHQNKTVLLPRPIDGALFAPPDAEQKCIAQRKFGLASDKPKVLFVGRLMPDKGEQFLHSLRDDSYDLIVCGVDHHNVESKQWLRDVIYFPPMPQQDLARLYQCADVLILPTCREGGLPLVAVEALACGLKVVMTNYIGSEHYQHIPNLHFCPERTTEALRKTLHEALQAEGTSTVEKCPEYDRVWMTIEDWIVTLYHPLSQQWSQVRYERREVLVHG